MGSRRGLLRHNSLALGGDFALFLVGLSFASPSTIMPAFAASLGAPNIVIGLIPAVATAGRFLPPLFAAGHTETLAAKLPFVLRYTVWERVPFLVLALVAFVVAERAPALALGLLIAMLAVIFGVGGSLMPAWMDVVAGAIPTTLRGRFFGIASVAGSAGGLAGSAATAAILRTVAPPASYGFCFLAATACMALSWAALATAREAPGAAPAPRVPLPAYLGRIPGLLRRDANLCWFLTGRAVAAIGTMSTGFFTVYALQALGAPAWRVGIFTSLLLTGQIIGNVGLGWLADRAGHRLVLILGAAALAVANGIALAASTIEVFGFTFVALGVYQAASFVSGGNALLEFAPDAATRPTYVGLGNTSLAPVAFGAPLLAGIVADTLGFGWVFLLGSGFAALGLGVLIGRVRDPRRAGRVSMTRRP